jgi:hypothetical protein
MLDRVQLVTNKAKAFEKNRFRPMYAAANMGHPLSLAWKRNPLGY